MKRYLFIILGSILFSYFSIGLGTACLDDYRSCVEDTWPQYTSCDETFASCDGRDEALTDIQQSYTAKMLAYANEYKIIANLLKGEQVNVYLKNNDETETFGISFLEESPQVTDPFDNPTITISLAQETVTAIMTADDPKTTAIDAFQSGEIKIKGMRWKVFKVILFQIGLKIAIPFFR